MRNRTTDANRDWLHLTPISSLVTKTKIRMSTASSHQAGKTDKVPWTPMTSWAQRRDHWLDLDLSRNFLSILQSKITNSVPASTTMELPSGSGHYSAIPYLEMKKFLNKYKRLTTRSSKSQSKRYIRIVFRSTCKLPIQNTSWLRKHKWERWERLYMLKSSKNLVRTA
jgi:hypothetical protein